MNETAEKTKAHVLLELAERVEQATGPDRELDADIALLLGWTEHHGDNWIGPRGEIVVPGFTSSLDAALTLVPEGHRWTVEGPDISTFGDDIGIIRPLAYVGPFKGDSDGMPVFAETPAAALTSASLRALAAMEG